MGKVYIYSYTGQLLNTIDNPTSGTTNEIYGFGAQICVVNNLIAVTADNRRPGNPDSTMDGHVYLFDQQGVLILSLESTFGDAGRNQPDGFGHSLCAAGSKLVVSSALPMTSWGCGGGSIFVYETDLTQSGFGTSPLRRIDLPVPINDPGISEGFGASLDGIDEDTVLVGAPFLITCTPSSSAYKVNVSTGAIIQRILHPYDNLDPNNLHCLSRFGQKVGYLSGVGSIIVDSMPDLLCAGGGYNGRIYYENTQNYFHFSTQTPDALTQNHPYHDLFGYNIATADYLDSGCQLLATAAPTDPGEYNKVGLYIDEFDYGPTSIMYDPVGDDPSFGAALDIGNSENDCLYIIADPIETVNGYSNAGAVYIYGS